ncbi:hypothetical protein DFQ27_005426 [Actinomortierella ambigua]|uniref:NAD(P)-binding domain-containing protein n=1 Tax=Actinomortierella ambigua TaxID=1343610 RepID=A0A9P6U2X2_9FUNG|nr:hypothetical protein DFQ27_005426 [Actinomortierella ambigua]
MRALVLGGSGNVGKLVLQLLLERGAEVQALVRTPEAIPADLTANKNLTLIQGSLLHLSVDDLAGHIKGCNAVIMTLGHGLSYGRVPALGLWMNPHELVVKATQMTSEAIIKLQPPAPIKFIILNTVGVANPDGSDPYQPGALERGLIGFMKMALPPYADSVKSAVYISQQIGDKHKSSLEWVVVRPDGFIDGEVCAYKLMEGIQHPFYEPDHITKANIAHFMRELAYNYDTWNTWKFKMPIIVNASQPHKEKK